MHRFLVCIPILLICLCCCRQKQSTPEPPAITIFIQPFDGMPEDGIQYVYQEVKKVYPNVKINPSIQLPTSAYFAARNRYRADSLIDFLDRKTPAGYITIGLTTKDISTKKDTIPDWGVMGLGFCPGKACIASTFRLSKTALWEQLFKVAIHESGHTQGLPHCNVATCFMRDAEGHNTTNEEKEFCPACKKLLAEKGWRF
ncbi:MAG: Zn-dependent protease [Bacteroidetes bacterium]|nr:Zn-dependent protease [Bacteroidota bacterium]